ncbi:hypothetical protein INT45_006287 [Circinella minor]|uniref:Uncharacterized protein n=1 Tax=Circinella minor TaxID=1195481 RepID=A0A8H7RZF3_9FUNG|nr:hypothetical protein INT45_006287 [Circinella minor]
MDDTKLAITEADNIEYSEFTAWAPPHEKSSNTNIWNQDKTAIIPELTVQYNGNTLFQPYDPKFLPPLKFNDNDELYVQREHILF